MSKMPWFRLYHEARSDAKLRLLADDEHRVWFDLLCFASEQETRGTIATGDDRFPLAVEVAHGDIDLLARTVSRLVKLRILTDSGDRLTFLHFSDRQYDKPSDAPERVAERVTRHRKGVTTRKVATETPVKRDETPVLFNTELEEELDPEIERRRPGAAAPVAAAAAVASEEVTVSKVKPAPKPNKFADVIDALRAVAIDVTTSKADAGAVKDCSAPAALIAEAYGAAYRGDWPPGETWLRNNLNLQAVCKRIDGYKAYKEGMNGGAQTRPGQPDRQRSGRRGDAGNPELAEYQRREEQRGLAALAEARRRRAAGSVLDS